MKVTLDAQVQINAQRIEKIKNDIESIRDNLLEHMAQDIEELKAGQNELQANVVKILTILAEK